MPITAELVDWLRREIGAAAADKKVAAGQAGKRVFYAAEIGPDGVFREFGASPSGHRAAMRDGRVVWPDDPAEARVPC